MSEETFKLEQTECGRLLEFFKYQHLPAHLQETSKQFHDLAWWIAGSTVPSAERTMALRKLLEAKDCAVRAKL